MTARLPSPVAVAVTALVVAMSASCSSNGQEGAGQQDAGNASDEVTATATMPDGVALNGRLGERPDLDLPKPYAVDTSVTVVANEGDGDVVTSTDSALVHFVALNARTGAELRASYEQGPEVLEPDSEGDLPYVLDAVQGQRVGDRLFIAIAPGDGYGDELSTADDSLLLPDDTLVYVMDILAVVLPGPSGTPADAVPPDLPQPVVDADDAVTSVTVPDMPPPSQVTAAPLIVGDGPAIGADSNVTVDYTGVLWDTGAVFDSSFVQGFPATFGLADIVPCWAEGLTGQTVGSRVVLVCPPDSAYGDKDQPGIPPGSTLAFVVDLLAVS